MRAHPGRSQPFRDEEQASAGGGFLARHLSPLLLLVVLFVAVTALAQDANPPSPPAQSSQLRVIVPWTHFGQRPADRTPGVNAAASQPGTQSSASSEPAAPMPGQPNDQPADKVYAGPPGQADSQAATAAPQAQLYEEDISKKHPHPPEPVTLPAANQTAPPLVSLSPADIEPAPPGLTPVPVQQTGSEASSAKPAQAAGEASTVSPETDIAAMTEAYEARRAGRESQLHDLHASSSIDPAAQTSVAMQETRLELEGEQDRMKTGQQLAKDFAALADELQERAGKVASLVNDRKQTESSSQAELNQLKDLMPPRELALRNLAQLPASAESDQTVQGLQAELTQEGATRKLATERAQEARQEIGALEVEAQQLQQAAARAREKSAGYAAVSEQARSNEARLADRMEYDEARQGAADLLASSSKALDRSRPLAPDVTLAPAAAAPQPAAGSSVQDQAAGSLRECIRKTGNVDSCLARGGGQ